MKVSSTCPIDAQRTMQVVEMVVGSEGGWSGREWESTSRIGL